MPAEPFDDSTIADYYYHCELCGYDYMITNDWYDEHFCSEQCMDLHYRRLAKLAVMINLKYNDGFIDKIQWSSIDYEYELVYANGNSILIGDFEEASQYLEI